VVSHFANLVRASCEGLPLSWSWLNRDWCRHREL